VSGSGGVKHGEEAAMSAAPEQYLDSVHPAIDGVRAAIGEIVDETEQDERVDKLEQWANATLDSIAARASKAESRLGEVEAANRTLIEEADRWQQAYVQARDDLAAANVRAEALANRVEEVEAELAAARQRIENSERYVEREIEPGLLDQLAAVRKALLPFLTPSPEHPVRIDEEADRVFVQVTLDAYEAAQRAVPDGAALSASAVTEEGKRGA
jgi:chromosome segregation ATPase